jgi:hypothetical protein
MQRMAGRRSSVMGDSALAQMAALQFVASSSARGAPTKQSDYFRQKMENDTTY